MMLSFLMTVSIILDEVAPLKVKTKPILNLVAWTTEAVLKEAVQQDQSPVEVHRVGGTPSVF